MGADPAPPLQAARRRFAALQARGVQPNKICVAIARELSGFIWAIGHQALSLSEGAAPATAQ